MVRSTYLECGGVNRRLTSGNILKIGSSEGVKLYISGPTAHKRSCQPTQPNSDYVGVFRNLQKALAIYGNAQGETEPGASPVHKKDELVSALRTTIASTTAFCMERNVNPATIQQARGFDRVKLVEDAVAAFVVNDDTRRGYLSRAGYVDRLFKSLLPDTAANEFGPICKVFRVIADKIRAITAARTLLESVCKHILEECGVEYSEKDELPKLYGMASKELNLAPSPHTEEAFKRILGGAHSVVDGLANLRNRLGDAHGQGKPSGEAGSTSRRVGGEYGREHGVVLVGDV